MRLCVPGNDGRGVGKRGGQGTKHCFRLVAVELAVLVSPKASSGRCFRYGLHVRCVTSRTLSLPGVRPSDSSSFFLSTYRQVPVPTCTLPSNNLSSPQDSLQVVCMPIYNPDQAPSPSHYLPPHFLSVPDCPSKQRAPSSMQSCRTRHSLYARSPLVYVSRLFARPSIGTRYSWVLREQNPRRCIDARIVPVYRQITHHSHLPKFVLFHIVRKSFGSASSCFLIPPSQPMLKIIHVRK